MFKKRSFQMLIAIAIVIMVALAMRELVAKANIMSHAEVTLGDKTMCARLPSRYSLHTELVKETGMLLPSTEDGPTGIDGGLMDLLSSYRTCSK